MILARTCADVRFDSQLMAHAFAALAAYGSDSDSDGAPAGSSKAPIAVGVTKTDGKASTRVQRAMESAGGGIPRALSLTPAQVAPDDDNLNDETSALGNLMRIRRRQKEAMKRQRPSVGKPASNATPTTRTDVEAAPASSDTVVAVSAREAAPSGGRAALPALPKVVSTKLAPETATERYRGRAGTSRKFTRLGWAHPRANEVAAATVARSPAAETERASEPKRARPAGIDDTVLAHMDPRTRREFEAANEAAVLEVSAGERQAEWESRPESAVPVQVAGPSVVVTKRWDAEAGATVTGAVVSTHERGKNQISAVAQQAAALRLQRAHTAQRAVGGGIPRVKARQTYGW